MWADRFVGVFHKSRKAPAKGRSGKDYQREFCNHEPSRRMPRAARSWGSIAATGSQRLSIAVNDYDVTGCGDENQPLLWRLAARDYFSPPKSTGSNV
jgi:hypothetical protein